MPLHNYRNTIQLCVFVKHSFTFLYEYFLQIRYDVGMKSADIEALYTVTAAIFPIGGLVGAVFVRSLVAKLGSRNVLIYSQVS